MVDKHIRKLDADLARFESDLKEQHAKETGYSDYESKFFQLRDGDLKWMAGQGRQPDVYVRWCEFTQFNIQSHNSYNKASLDS